MPIERTMREATPIARQVFTANMAAFARYVARPYAGTAVMLLARDEPDRTAFDDRLTWADLVEGGLTVRFIPGDHENLLDEPGVREVGAVVRRILDRALA